LQNDEETIPFDKDDDDTLDFVTASSNLRSVSYGIEEKTRWEVKGEKNPFYMPANY
jgi:ubiquitin-like 1-activating enzyme E1 B